MRPLRRLLRAGILALCLVHSVHAAPPPVADFFRRPLVHDIALSPSGRYVAIESARNTGRVQISVLDIEHPEDTRIVAGWGDLDAVGVQWITDDRLLFAAVDLSVNLDDWRSRTRGWMAVNRDGTRMLASALGVNAWPVAPLGDGSLDMVVMRSNGDRKNPVWSLWRISTRSGHDTRLAANSPAGTFSWVLDEKGTPRALVTKEADRAVLYRAEDDGQRWVKVIDQPLFGGARIAPLAYRHGQMYVVAGAGDADLGAVFSYDLQTGKLGDKPIVQVQDYDFNGALVFDDETGRLIGIRHLTEDWSTTWLDAEMQAIQAKVDRRVPTLLNQIVCTRCLKARRLVVRSLSDRQPMIYSIYDRETGELRAAAPSRPWIDAAQMGERETTRFNARDGLSIPVTVTLPPGARDGDPPRPAVVLIHGGPWSRGAHWGWSAQPQFLASRGYVVLEPEFRGSTGFGGRHFRAGFKQWGLAMQDDIADTAAWAAKRGLIDPQRVCLAGASYGGYATLMGLIKHAQQFRCGVSWVGPTDIDSLYEFDWSDFDETTRRYGLPTLVADRQADVEQIRATSPLRQAARLTQPLLLAYGAKDRRVPIEHGMRLRDALRPVNAKVEWVEYRTEGHGWFLLDNDVDFWTRVERFLARELAVEAVGSR